MNPKTEKPLKKIKAQKQQKERDEQLLKPVVRIQELKNKLIILGHELFATKRINESLHLVARVFETRSTAKQL